MSVDCAEFVACQIYFVRLMAKRREGQYSHTQNGSHMNYKFAYFVTA